MRFHPLIILPIYLISCPIIILSSPMIQKGILLRGPNWPYTCFRFYDIIFENLVTLIWELTTLVAHFSYFCCIFIVFWNILSNYPISSLKIRRVILIWELAAPIKLSICFHDISTIFYNILSNYPENLVGNLDTEASCPDQTFLLCCNCSSASTVPLHKQPASSSSS